MNISSFEDAVDKKLKEMGLSIYTEIINERSRQDERWGEQNHHPVGWLSILGEEYGEACKEVNQIWIDGQSYKGDNEQLEFLKMAQAAKLRQELIQVAAVTVAMIESLDRNELKNYKDPYETE